MLAAARLQSSALNVQLSGLCSELMKARTEVRHLPQQGDGEERSVEQERMTQHIWALVRVIWHLQPGLEYYRQKLD